jgi:hypothetical protein
VAVRSSDNHWSKARHVVRRTRGDALASARVIAHQAVPSQFRAFRHSATAKQYCPSSSAVARQARPRTFRQPSDGALKMRASDRSEVRTDKHRQGDFPPRRKSCRDSADHGAAPEQCAGIAGIPIRQRKALWLRAHRFSAGRGANEPFAHERTAGRNQIRPLVGALETNSGMKLAADQNRPLEFSRNASLVHVVEEGWIASRSLSPGRPLRTGPVGS